MKRKLGKKNMILFVLFSILVLIIILLFAYAIYVAFSYDKTVYSLEEGSFLYDSSNHYISLSKQARVSQKWDKHYYLYLDSKSQKKTTDLGEDVVVYHEDDYKIQVIGKNYQIQPSGSVLYSDKLLEVAWNGSSSIYKLDDRKYLIVGKSISTEKKEIETGCYLLIEIDKSGNALLLNQEMNIKTLSTLTLITNEFSFDVANERLIVGDDVIDLKKINGSTNQYVEPQDKDEVDRNQNSQNTNSGSGNGNLGSSSSGTSMFDNGLFGGVYGNSGGAIVSGNTSKGDSVEIKKSANLTGITSSTSYIDVSYFISDPRNEYSSVYLMVEGVRYSQKFVLNKNNTSYRVRELAPNSSYTLRFCVSYLDSSHMLVEDVLNTLVIKTNRNSSTIVLNRVSGNRVYFTVHYDSSYAYDSANVNLYSDGEKVGSVAVSTAQALSEDGFTGYIDVSSGLGTEIVLRLEDCIYHDTSVQSSVFTKFVNR